MPTIPRRKRTAAASLPRSRTEVGSVALRRFNPDRVVHCLAVLTVLVSLAPIGLGSLVTTLGAGMAFPDWPTSDGQGMLAYPWLSSSGDKFVEHGHRLAGMAVGVAAIVLCMAAMVTRRSRGVQVACGVVLAGVIVQGLLGGLRVRLDQQTVAFGHSVFGCMVFVALWCVASMTSRRWELTAEDQRLERRGVLTGCAVLFPFLCLVQYVLGGFIRHLGMLVHEHVAGAVLVTLASGLVLTVSLRADSARLRRAGWGVAVACLIQIAIGCCVWLTRFGLPSAGWVAVQHSLPQVVARTLHTVAGMGVVATSVGWSVSVLRSGRSAGVGNVFRHGRAAV